MLKLSDIKKDYKIASGYVHALKGVSLEFRKSEFVCILGQSGCGKTTLLNIVGGLDHYTSGDLVIQGKSTKDFKDRDWDVYRNHRIGFIFQSYNLIPHQTVLGNVELALTIAGVGREERHARAKEALERVGLGEELNKKPNQLSGGQMQRVAIARALVNNPDILLADEPTGALDSKTSVEVMDLIKEISGERLVIMVTHNPELAQEYATRIVRLHDGLVEADSNPYHGEDEGESAAADETEVAPEEAPAGKKGKREKKPRAKMGLFTSLALSAKNLLTKKGRTIITSVAGSIGIISVCLVLALSSGFSNYIRKTEEDMLSYYPVQIQESSYDMTSMMASFTSPKDMPDLERIGDNVYIDSFLTNLAKGMAVTNNISDKYLEYLDGMDDSWYSAIQYGYGVTFADNLFTKVDTMEVNGSTTELTPTVRSLANLKQHYIDVLQTQADEYKQLTGFARFFANIVHKMPGTDEIGSEKYAEYVLSQYDILGGEGAHFPENKNEIALVIGTNNEVTDLTLAQLGFLDEARFLSLFELGRDDAPADGKDYMEVAFSDILGKEYTLFYNDAVYEENTNYQPPFTSGTVDYPFVYSGRRDNLTAAEGEGLNLKISCILRLKDGLTYGCLKPGLNLTEETVMSYIDTNINSKIVQWVKGDKGHFTITIPDEKEPGKVNTVVIYFSPAVQMDSYYAALGTTLGDSYSHLIPKGLEGLRVNTDNTTVYRALGGSKVVSTVSIYATDFDGKDHVLEYLDAWNEAEGREEGDKITYTDTVGLLMGMMQTMLNVITYVLVAFTAISLVVSSVMIGIITYVSVVERVKEIGVLRSLGARKRDIKNLFNAETFIIGLGAGLIGVVVTYLLSALISAVIYSFTGIAGIASLPILTAVIMICVSVGLTLISGLIPAAAAAKKDPVIALRTE